MFESYLGDSILERAIKEKKIKVSFYNPRTFACPTEASKKRRRVEGKGFMPYLKVDDKPYGGGPGMVMRAEPVLKAVEAAMKKIKKAPTKVGVRHRSDKIKIIFFSPAGKKFDTDYVKKTSKKFTDIILISGRYEGIDARVLKILKSSPRLGGAEDISIGDYVLTGGELPAMVLIDSISRQIPGVLGKYESLEEERVSSSEIYTRPEIFEYTPPWGRGKKVKKYRVPKVLLSGDHKKIDEWKQSRK